MVEPLIAISAAAPWTTVKAPSVPVVSPVAVASIVTEPTSAPVIVLVAMPLAAVAVPVPVTVPAPDCLAKVTTVVLSEVTVLPAASWIVAVSTRVAPEVRLVVDAGEHDLGGGAVDDGEGAERAGGEPGRGRLHRDGADEGAGDRLGGDAGGGGGGAGAGDGAGAGRLAKVTTVELSEVTVLPAASWIVAVRTRVAPEVRLVVAPVSAIWAAAPWTTVKAPSVPVVRPPAVASIVTEPTSAPVIVLVATPAAAVAVPVPVTVPAPDGLAKVTTVRVVGGDGVAGGVLDRRGQHPRRPGGEVGGRARERDLGGGAVDDGEGAERAGRQPGGGRLHRDRARRGRR